jgi:hypothetical protein
MVGLPKQIINISCCLFVAAFCFTALWVKAQTTLVLVKDGISNYQIIISKNADTSAKNAAFILQDYLKKISGVQVKLNTDRHIQQHYEIVIGKTNRSSEKLWKTLATGLKEDGYYLKTIGEKLFIAGGTGKGIIYGVVGFLEDHLGCRKYAPETEFIPDAKTIAINYINDKQVPPAGIRIINGAFPADPGYKDWRKLSTVADNWSDGEWKGYYVHTFNRLVPSQDYFEKHPEYFAMVNNKRIPHGQLCLSNPDVYVIAVKKLKEEMALHPRLKYWSVSQNDNYDFCQCDECKKVDAADGGPTGSLLNFVNKVAAEFPGKTITTLAYQYSRKPPLQTRPAANVMITLCTIELNRSLPIETDPASASFKNDIVAWSKICKNIMLWDYEVQFTNYLCPFPLFHTLQPNLQFFTKYGVTAHFQQCNAVHGVEFAELKTYLLSKLLWNPDADAGKIIDDFMVGYYGHAAPYIREYFNLLHREAAASKQGLDIYGTPVWNANTFLSVKNIGLYYQLFDKAEAAVIEYPELMERVKIDRLCVQYADMEIAKTDMFGERGWYNIVNGKYILRPERKQLLEDFYATCKKNNVSKFNEMGLTADTYYNNTLRFIDVQVEGNLAFKKTVTCFPDPNEKYTAMGPSTLTNGVKGTDDYKINWLGWEGKDVEILVDLEKSFQLNEITISSLQFPKSWIVHPLKITCLLSDDGKVFSEAGTITSAEDLQTEQQMKNFCFKAAGQEARYIKFLVSGSKILPAWHNYAGNKSWVFIDEIVVK